MQNQYDGVITEWQRNSDESLFISNAPFKWVQPDYIDNNSIHRQRLC